MSNLGTILTAVAAVIGALGLRELIQFLLSRRDKRTDDRQAEKRTRDREMSVVEADANRNVLDVLLREMRDRIDSYEGMIRDMRDQHTRDLAEVKAEARVLDRQVRDLQVTLRDWQLGNRTPRGQVLIPLREIQRLRERHPGVLDSNFYPGEDLAGDDPSIVARITPMLPPTDEGR